VIGSLSRFILSDVESGHSRPEADVPDVGNGPT